MKTAFITGAASGIGEALVVRLHREGWQVFAGYRNSPPDQTRWHSMVNAIALPCDVTDPAQICAAANTISEHTGGRLDLLINNAGYSSREGVIEAANMDEYRRAFEVNFWGPLQVAQAMLPMLRHSEGRIINTTSASVYMTIPMASAYPAAKSALVVLTRHLRMELAPFGIEVTNLVPSGVDTPMVDTTPEAAEQFWTLIPEPLRDQYRQHFLDGASAIGDNFKLKPPDVFADKVFKKIICARHLKLTYVIGPRSSAVLPWLDRLLPAQQVQNIWRRMFTARPHR
ncbi:SDR family oxidoreductase [Mycobacterium sp. NPDC051804]|uniref:SDR family oxidoreductase n=1 Tax=Mycobacterium sp. NPDC051804 TaxID=3364295 RepID=UPI003787BAF8